MLENQTKKKETELANTTAEDSDQDKTSPIFGVFPTSSI